MQCTVDSTVLSALEWKVVGWGWRYISGASAVHLPRLIFPKMQWNAPHNPPSLSDALCSISLVHPLSLAMQLLIETSWPLIYDLFYHLCSQPPAQNSFQLHYQLHKYSTLLPLLSSFQTPRLSAVRMAEDNLEMGKGSVGQIWDWSKLIGPWLIKTDQTVGSSCGQKQTMDLWELRGKLKRVKTVSICLLRAQNLNKKFMLWLNKSGLHVLHEILPACSICPLKAVGVGELQGWGGKRGAVGAFAQKKSIWAPVKSHRSCYNFSHHLHHCSSEEMIY